MSHEAVAHPAADRRAILRTLGLAVPVPAAAIVLHELGHFTVHAAFGYEVNRLTYQSVRSGGAPAGVDPVLADGLSFAAGTGVSLVLAGLAVWWVAARGPHPVALAVAVFESVRALLGLVGRVAGAGVAETLTGGFGELRYAVRGLGGPGAAETVVSWVELAIPLAALVFVLRRYPVGARLAPTAAATAGVALGVALWMGVLGPVLLPG